MYFEEDRGRVAVAYYRQEPDDVIATFFELVRSNLQAGAEVGTIERWAKHLGHYGRIALMEQEVAREGWDRGGLMNNLVQFTKDAYGVTK